MCRIHTVCEGILGKGVFYLRIPPVCTGCSSQQSHMLFSKRERVFHVKSGNVVPGEVLGSPCSSRMSYPFCCRNPCLHCTSFFSFCNVSSKCRVCKPKFMHTRRAHNSAMPCATVLAISRNPRLRPTDLKQGLSNDVGAEWALRLMERLTNLSTTITDLMECEFDIVILR